MDKLKDFFNSTEHARGYDKKAENAGWLGPKIFHELLSPYLSPGDKLLDLGIGTGLAAAEFKAEDLKIHGMDFSMEMLKICREKNIADELKEHDLRTIPYPYGNGSMQHIICAGVLHIFPDLKPIFREICRILDKDGTFTFTCIERNEGVNSEFQQKITHKSKVVEKTLKLCGFDLLDSRESITGGNGCKHIMRAYIAKKV